LKEKRDNLNSRKTPRERDVKEQKLRNREVNGGERKSCFAAWALTSEEKKELDLTDLKVRKQWLTAHNRLRASLSVAAECFIALN